MKRLSFLLLTLTFVTACAQAPEVETVSLDEPVVDAHEAIPEGWVMLDEGHFTLYAPAGWKLMVERDSDYNLGSFSVGNISGDGTTLLYDSGVLSLSKERESNFDIVKEKIDGFDVTILTPKITGADITAVYFDDPREMYGVKFNGLIVAGKKLTADQEALALRIFHTIQFKQ